MDEQLAKWCDAFYPGEDVSLICVFDGRESHRGWFIAEKSGHRKVRLLELKEIFQNAGDVHAYVETLTVVRADFVQVLREAESL